MRKLIMSSMLIIVTNTVFGQWTNSTSNNYIYNSNSGGNVGIGFDNVTPPTATLGVKSPGETIAQIETSNLNSPTDLIFRSANHQFKISKSAQGTGNPTGSSAYLTFSFNNNIYGGDRPMFQLYGSTSSTSVLMGQATVSSLGGPTVAVGGTFGARQTMISLGDTWLLGSATLLGVNGTIACRAVNVTTASTFPDYVFEKGYDLKNLLEIEKYIKANSHLPGIPSAQEVKKDGLDLGSMTIKMVEKIEELTLYMIELKKENELLNSRLRELERK